MKKYQKIVATLFILLVLLACELPGKNKPTPLETEAPGETQLSAETIAQGETQVVIAPEENSKPTKSSDPCSQLNLTPEECSNIGTHTYYFETEFSCRNVNSPNTEKILVIFTESAVQIQKIEPVDQTWIHEFDKISENTYIREIESEETEKNHVTLEFIMNGFTTSTTVPDLVPCGKYIRTIISD